jgi:hypothetical protein
MIPSCGGSGGRPGVGAGVAGVAHQCDAFRSRRVARTACEVPLTHGPFHRHYPLRFLGFGGGRAASVARKRAASRSASSSSSSKRK